MSQLFPTQEADESLQSSFDETDRQSVWGRLLPLKSKLQVVGYMFSDVNSVQTGFPSEVTSKYTICCLLGRYAFGIHLNPFNRGACGEVRLVFDKDQCKRYAMKIVSKKNLDLPIKKHPCIIYTYDVIETDDAVHMVLELVEGGELFDRVVQSTRLPEDDAKYIFLQIALAVQYLHDNGITHRDLKPENILMSSSETRCLIKVTDFGLSKLVDGTTMLRTFCGTPTYLAPEVLRTTGSGTYTSSIDIWSLGVILFVCLAGYPPFTAERTDFDLETQIVEGRFDFPEPLWTGISEDAIDLIKKMLELDPSKRLTIKDVLSHAWLSDPVIKQQIDERIAKEFNPENRVRLSPIASPDNPNNDGQSSDSGVVATLPKDTTINVTTCVTPKQDAILKDKPLIHRKRHADDDGDCTLLSKHLTV